MAFDFILLPYKDVENTLCGYCESVAYQKVLVWQVHKIKHRSVLCCVVGHSFAAFWRLLILQVAETGFLLVKLSLRTIIDDYIIIGRQSSVSPKGKLLPLLFIPPPGETLQRCK